MDLVEDVDVRVEVLAELAQHLQTVRAEEDIGVITEILFKACLIADERTQFALHLLCDAFGNRTCREATGLRHDDAVTLAPQHLRDAGTFAGARFRADDYDTMTLHRIDNLLFVGVDGKVRVHDDNFRMRWKEKNRYRIPGK